MIKSKGIIKSLFEKPWEKDQIEIDNKHQGQTLNLSKYKTLMKLYDQADVINDII